MTTEQPKPAIAYYRVSSEKQRETQSITLQKIKLTTFAKDKGYAIIKEFMDDGISGESISKRPGFQDCLEYISDGNIDYLLVYMIDRIGRFAARKDRNQVVELLEETHTSIDGPYDGQFLYNNESDMNALEVALNESRRDNVKRAIRIHEGHMAKRLAGGFSGGKTPYGIRYDKKSGFTIVPAERDTLQEIFKRIAEGMGLIPLREYLNSDLKRFPKRLRKFKGRAIAEWVDGNIHQIAHNNFYFTGIIQPTKESLEKGVPAADTGIKLFPQPMIEHARREMATRRFRDIDNRMEDRQRTHAQQGKIYFTDALLHGLVRCAHCGNKLGLQQIRKPSRSTINRYYLCRNHTRKTCDLKIINASKLDKAVWNTFIKTVEDPDSMKTLIMEGQFLVDKDRASQEEALTKAGLELSKLHDTILRIKDLYQWGDIKKEDYQERTERMQRLLKQKEGEVYRLEASIQQPKEIEAAVKDATEYVTKQMETILYLDRIETMIDEIGNLDKGIDPDNLPARLKALQSQKELMTEAHRMLKTLDGEIPDIGSDTIRAMIFQQKRTMLQRFIDFDESKGIRVSGLDDIEIYFSFESLTRLLQQYEEILLHKKTDRMIRQDGQP